MRYLDQVAIQSVSIQIGTAAAGANRRASVGRVRVAEEDARDWRVNLAPITFAEIAPGTVVDFTGGHPNKPRAYVNWGLGNVIQTAIVDWPAPGGSFAVWGDTVTVDFELPATWVVASGNASVVTGAMIVPHSGGKLRPTHSLYSGLIAPGAFSNYLFVPPFARAFRWHEAVNGSGAHVEAPIAFLGYMDTGGFSPTQLTPHDVYTSSERTWPSADGITLAADTRVINVENRSAANLGLTLEFVLDLG